jgi:hypothetical protein
MLYIPTATSTLRRTGCYNALVLGGLYACARLHMYIPTAISPSPRRHSTLVHSAVYARACLHMYTPTAIFARLRLIGMGPLCSVLCVHVAARLHRYIRTYGHLGFAS